VAATLLTWLKAPGRRVILKSFIGESSEAEMAIDRRTLLVAGLATIVTSPAIAESFTPMTGSPERRALLDAVRPSVEAKIGPPVVFVVHVIHVWGDWAYVQAVPQRPGGVPIDWSRTKFKDDFAKDFMTDIVMCLLRRNGAHWTVAEFVLGPTDVFWENWVGKYRLPRTLFLPPNGPASGGAKPIEL
jgi:hypothetical protein